MLSGIVSIQIKQLSRTEPADRIVLWTTLLWVPMSLLPALFVWEWPQGITWLWVIAAGLLGTGGHMLWTRALKLGDVSALTPISFMQLPLVAVFGCLLFDENARPLDRCSAPAIIFAANAYIAHREAQLARRMPPGAGRSGQTRRVVVPSLLGISPARGRSARYVRAESARPPRTAMVPEHQEDSSTPSTRDAAVQPARMSDG